MADPLYHVTFSKNLSEIQKRGLDPLSGSLWQKAETGGRYQDQPSVYSFQDPEEALLWASKMKWEFRDDISDPSDISIVKLRGGDHWEPDPAAGGPDIGKTSMRSLGHVPFSDILEVISLPKPAGGNEEFQAHHPSGDLQQWLKFYGNRLRGQEPRSPDKSKLPAVIDAASVAAEAARLGADESRTKGKGAAFRGLGSLARPPIFKIARLVQEGYNLLPEDYKVIEDWVDRMKETQAHELFGMDKPGIEYLKEWLGMEKSEPGGGIITLPDLQKYVDLYHGTPNVWSSEEGYPKGRADLEYALTGEGVAAYGPGLYSAEVRDIARDEYRNPEGRHKLLSGQLEPKIEYAFSLLENEATASDVMNNMFNKYEGITFDTIMQSIDAARDEGAGKGALYKLQVPESVEKTFLDWDKPLSKQSGIVRKLIKASGMSRQELMGLEDQLEKAAKQLYAKSKQDPKGNWIWDKEALSYWDALRKSNVAERKLGQFLEKMELDPGVKVKVPKGMDPDITMDLEVSKLRGGDLLTAMGKDKKAVKLFDKAGIPGLRFLDQKSRGVRVKIASEPWPERTRNRVIWNQKLLNEVSRTLKREMAAGGFVTKPLYDDARIGGMI